MSDVGLFVIDGIRDPMLNINNFTEATHLVGRLDEMDGRTEHLPAPCYTSARETTTPEGT